MKKKWIAFALTAAMVSMSLAGCQGQADSGAGTAAETAVETTGTEAGAGGEAVTKTEADKGAGTGAENGTVAAGAQPGDMSGSILAEEKGTISVTYVKSPLNVPSIVEKDQQIFAKRFGELGYGVAYSDLTTGPEQIQALASGDIQFLYAVGATSVILAAANEADIRIISTYSRSPEAFKLFGKDGSIKSPEDLKGKKVAGPKGTILHELLVAYLAGAGMTENDIEFLSMGIPDAQAALAGGSVDAALLAGPVAYNMEHDGFPVITDGTGLTEATIVVAASGAYIDSHPEEVKAFLEAQKQVLDTIEADKDAAMEATAKETELTVEAVKEMYPMYDFDMTIRDSDIEAMKKTEAFMKDNGMIEEDVDIDALIWRAE